MTEQVDTQQTASRDFEAEARQQGWKPKEEFSGDPGRWTDAETFVRKGEQIAAIVNKRAEGLKTELDRTRAELAEIKAVAKEFREHQQKMFAEKESRLKSEIESLRAQRREAISAGDGERVDEIEQQIDSLKDQAKDIKTTAKEEKAQGVDPALQQWVSENAWYNESPRMAAYANAVAAELVQQGIQGPAMLAKIREEVEKEFPAKFKKETTRNPLAAQASDDGREVKTGGKSYRDLPDEAKRSCDKFVKLGAVTREQFVKDYFA